MQAEPGSMEDVEQFQWGDVQRAQRICDENIYVHFSDMHPENFP